MLSVPYGGGPNQPLSPAQRHAYWYQWFFGTEQARYVLEEHRNSFCEYLWKTWMPAAHFSETEFAATALSWDNPDWVEVTLHSYRSRWALALPDPQYGALEATQLLTPPLQVPTTLLHGAEDGATLAASVEGKDHLFAASYSLKILPGVGHFVPREQPDTVIKAIVEG